MKRNAVIDGITQDNVGTYKCWVCDTKDQPQVSIFTHQPAELDIRVCVPCLAKAIQLATGWKVINTFSQWRLQQITGRKTQDFKARVRDAVLKGEPVPERPDDVWKPGARAW